MLRLSDADRRKIKRGLTAAELRAELECYPDDAVVVFACEYGDYGKTMQALPVMEVDVMLDDEQYIAPSAYSHSGLAFEDFSEEEWDAGMAWEGPEIVILR